MDRTKLLIIGIVVGLIVIFGLFFLVFQNLGGTALPQEVTLQMWGVFDDPSYYQEAIRQFEAQNKSVRVIYRSFNFEEYESQLLNSFAAGTGPDIFLMHNTWLPKHINKIQPLPAQIPGRDEPLLLFKDFQTQFVDVAVNDLTRNGQIYGLPLYVDTLGLYYNKDFFNTAGITSTPKTYEDFNADVTKLSQVSNQSRINRSGAALGTARNINRSTDILMMLMLQSGVRMTDANNSRATFSQSIDDRNVGQVALQYYTDFANSTKQVYTWNSQQDYSIDAFINGKTAMMFNYSHQIKTIRDKAARFNFGVAPVPQISSSPKSVAYANYWAPTVAKQSTHPNEAWQFLVSLSSKDGVSAYINASQRPSARRDLIELQRNDPDLGVFAVQALSARSWYQIDNAVIETIFADMIEAVNFGRNTVRDALQAAENQVNVLMNKARSQTL